MQKSPKVRKLKAKVENFYTTGAYSGGKLIGIYWKILLSIKFPGLRKVYNAENR